MDTVFNPPMASHGVGKGFHRGETEQKVARFLRDLVLEASFCSHHPNALQTFPLLLRIKIGQNLWVTDGPILSDF